MSAQFLEVHEQYIEGEGPARLINIATILDIFDLPNGHAGLQLTGPNEYNQPLSRPLVTTAAYAELRHALASAGLVAIPIPGATGGL